ncbi:aromatic ring-hydroxylating dioxygenase subunit alpha [Sphingomonas sp. MG17]|uniref:Aromatic ring-hydroxylating dioxygenase subunit alpha n=1 Tax=Sphingomonas tagetis TaxID=2949092 RepID=A0A9X2KND0_9SPHN|nr:aromatic ring-hydroxylating dioxygenase subunit alpha [Sphingomonas tagetis]MCP3732730.1 aromatic ring-hydroxylating dioxygenase subunit alpha [Sphingomonas tagetis]
MLTKQEWTADRRAGFAALLGRQRPGWSLEQPFYLDPTIYALERELWFPRQWIVMAHVSELPRRGDRIVRDLFGEEIIIVNAGTDGFHAFYNVCTHRGSRICRDETRTPNLVCPYHAWGFRLTGELLSGRDLPEGADKAELGLHRIGVREAGGLIFCGLDEESLPDLAPALDTLLPALRHHGFHNARIAERRSYPTSANWKLVLENFFECYHCRPSHPEYFRMNGHVAATAVSDEVAAAEWEGGVSAWREQAVAPALDRVVRHAGDIDEVKYSLYRQPIGLGRDTQSHDGKPIAPLMGDFTHYDGGETAMHLGRLSFAGCYNDHAVIFQFMPRGVEETNVVATWLVDADADPGTLDIGSLTFMWDVTTKQDKRIIEDNAAGVRSRAYRPGPYTALESQSASFVASYLEIMGRLVG